MIDFQNTRQLNVYRRLSHGEKILVGQLAQNKQGIFFQYDANYLSQFHSLSPFHLSFDYTLALAPRTPHQGLHGVFADSLPDGWGLLLMDRIFQRHNIQPQQLTAIDRLAYIGERGTGALSYSPVSSFSETDNSLTELTELGQQAIQLFDGQTEEVLTALANAGGSGGARPKALIYFDPEKPERVATNLQAGLQAWLIKFTSQNLLLGHDEGRCEAAFLTMAQDAGIQVPSWRLMETIEGKAWLAQRRFDCNPDYHAGRYHVHSLCGLLDADFRLPSVDYEDLIKASQILCQSPAAGKDQFVRALFNLFNLFACNQDDHSKNWSFIMSDQGKWQATPFFDVTFSPSLNHEHTTSYMGYGKKPTLKAIQYLAEQANFSSWQQAKEEILRIVEALS